MSLTVSALGTTLTGTGDAGIWWAPRTDGNGAVAVLRLTTSTGQTFTVELTAADVERLADTAAAVADATDAEREAALDRAAWAIHSAVDTVKTLGPGEAVTVDFLT